MASHVFFAMLSRMKYICRWGLMRSTHAESIAEHSHETAVLAHALALIENTYFGGHVNADRAAVMALYHDSTEVLTGDLPTPVKYHHPALRAAYGEVEHEAADRLRRMLPPELAPALDPLVREQGDERAFVKAADKLSALIKCIEERRMGNCDFISAEKTLRASVKALHMPSVDYFLTHFLPAYALTLDEQQAQSAEK